MHNILRTDIMRRELIRATLEAAPALTACVWSPYNGARPTRPYAEWRPIAQPATMGTLADDVTTMTIVRQADVQILNAVDGQRYRIGYNYSAASALAGPTSTPTTLQAALVLAINADREPVTAAAVGADVVRLTGDADGGLWRCEAVGELFDVTPTAGAAEDVVELQRGTLRMTASLNIYSCGVGTLDESSLFAHRVMSALRSRREIELFGQNYLSTVRLSAPVSLNAVPASGTAYESRTTVDYAIRLPYWAGTNIESIDSVVGSVSIGASTAAFTV